MRIYFQFLGWLLRRVTKSKTSFFKRQLHKYRTTFRTEPFLAFLMSFLAWMLMALVVLISSAIAACTKAQFLDNLFYSSLALGVFIVYNWLAAWFEVFEQERQELLDILADG